MTETARAAPTPEPSATRALSMSTIAFTVCFAVWTIFSIIGVGIKDELGLSDTQFGLLIGMPVLTGSLVRLVLGIWTKWGALLGIVYVVIATALAHGDMGHVDSFSPSRRMGIQ